MRSRQQDPVSRKEKKKRKKKRKLVVLVRVASRKELCDFRAL
jgi:hypothetical protein